MSNTLLEHRFTCPYCWEPITMLLDLSIEEQSYVEDCEVCCNPISLSIHADDRGLVHFDARRLD